MISTQNWLILAKFPPKNPAKLAVLVFVFPRNFPWNRPIFLRICLWKSFETWHFSLKPREIGRFFSEFWLFSCKNTTNRPIFPRILTFFPRKSRENIGRFFREFAPENSAKFCFFSAKYQKPWDNDDRSVSSIDPTVIYKRIYLPSWGLELP